MTSPTNSEATISLTTDEYEALAFAADMLTARADALDAPEPRYARDANPYRNTPAYRDQCASITDTYRREADALRRLHDRWHHARVVAAGVAHDPACGYCARTVAS
jgi:hypothetical protein